MAEENNMRSMMRSSYGDSRADKSEELNETMTIRNTGQDEYTRTLKNIGGNN